MNCAGVPALKQDALDRLHYIIQLVDLQRLGKFGWGTVNLACAFAKSIGGYENYIIVYEGDSLTYVDIYPNAVETLLDIRTGSTTFNVAASGERLSPTMIDDAAAQVDVHYSASAFRNIAILWAGTNDFGLYENLSAADLHVYIQTWCAARKAVGFQVVVCTLTPRSIIGTPENFESRRIQLNALIRANYATYADGLADLAADSRIGNAGDEQDTTYYLDLLHMTAAGYAIVAEIVANAIIALP